MRFSVDSRIHLAQVVLSLARGGSETLARNIGSYLDSSRFQSSICALDEAGALAEDLPQDRVRLHVLNRRPGFDWRLPLKLYRTFRRERVAVVQTHHLAPLIYSAVAARLSGAALVHVEHEQFSFTPSRRARLRRLAPLCHRVVVVGEDLKRFFVECVGLDPRRLVVINNGVEVDKYALGPSEERKDLGLPADGRLVGHVARLDPAKDQASLIRAFACARLTHQDIRLVIVGDGPSRAGLERLADDLRVRDRVTFLGSRSDVPRLLTHFELFVLSSTQEGLPLALLEAMACGKPVVVTAVGEIPRIVEDGATGVLVPPGEPAALAGALVRLLRRPVEAEALGAAARALVRARYDLSATIRQYEALYVGLQRAAEAGR